MSLAAIQIIILLLCDEVLPPICWSDLSKFSKLMASPSFGL